MLIHTFYIIISGNPLATLKWFNGDKELVSIYLTRDNYASAEVAFVPKGQDNGGQLRCEATNMASMQPFYSAWPYRQCTKHSVSPF